MLDETSLGFVLRFNGTSSSETRKTAPVSLFRSREDSFLRSFEPGKIKKRRAFIRR